MILCIDRVHAKVKTWQSQSFDFIGLVFTGVFIIYSNLKNSDKFLTNFNIYMNNLEWYFDLFFRYPPVKGNIDWYFLVYL
jgi:hypothetical protein